MRKMILGASLLALVLGFGSMSMAADPAPAADPAAAAPAAAAAAPAEAAAPGDAKAKSCADEAKDAGIKMKKDKAKFVKECEEKRKKGN